jgi:hypothetical protein
LKAGPSTTRRSSEFRSSSAPSSAGGSPRAALWILLVAVLVLVLLDSAVDDTRFEDIPFFVVVGVFLFGLGLLARWIATVVARHETARRA